MEFLLFARDNIKRMMEASKVSMAELRNVVRSWMDQDAWHLFVIVNEQTYFETDSEIQCMIVEKPGSFAICKNFAKNLHIIGLKRLIWCDFNPYPPHSRQTSMNDAYERMTLSAFIKLLAIAEYNGRRFIELTPGGTSLSLYFPVPMLFIVKRPIGHLVDEFCYPDNMPPELAQAFRNARAVEVMEDVPCLAGTEKEGVKTT